MFSFKWKKIHKNPQAKSFLKEGAVIGMKIYRSLQKPEIDAWVVMLKCILPMI